MSGQERKADTILMADQTQEAAELHPSIGAAIRVGIKYLHQIEQLADSFEKSA